MKKIYKVLSLILATVILLQSSNVQAASNKNVVLSPYQIKVNRVANCVTVYQLKKGVYEPLRSFACSVGKNIEDTPLGEFRTSDYYDWRLMVDDSYGQYAVRFNKGILFHSVPYLASSPDTLEADQFNLLGSPASLGCVRLCVADVKWIYDNCPKGTSVIVYDDMLSPGPIGKPEAPRTHVSFPFSGWDPTDPRPENPWKSFCPSMYLKLDIGDGVLYMLQGSKVEDMAINNVGCKDALGNELIPGQYTVSMNGNYDLNTPGTYRVWVTVTDALGLMDQQEMTLAVVGFPQ